MTEQFKETSSEGQQFADGLKSLMMIALTAVFVLLYIAALTGYLKPLDKPDMLMRLEPIIFVIIGYYFGRLPTQQSEKTLKNEINRQTQKADAAQHAKEKALQEREMLEEKVKNAASALVFTNSEDGIINFNVDNTNSDDRNSNNKILQDSINVAKRILVS
jgi:hypothetical protein